MRDIIIDWYEDGYFLRDKDGYVYNEIFGWVNGVIATPYNAYTEANSIKQFEETNEYKIVQSTIYDNRFCIQAPDKLFYAGKGKFHLHHVKYYETYKEAVDEIKSFNKEVTKTTLFLTTDGLYRLKGDYITDRRIKEIDTELLKEAENIVDIFDFEKNERIKAIHILSKITGKPLVECKNAFILALYLKGQ